MTGRKLVFSALVVCGLSLVLAAAGAQAVKTFSPPRTAVVDISAVFEAYQKKIDLQERLQEDTDALEAKLKTMDEKYNNILDELKLVQPGSGREEELQFEKLKLEQGVKRVKQSELKKLHEKRVSFLKEIQGEITQEIEDYYKANNLDLVLEKLVRAESGGGAVPRFEWPVVHASKPELDITEEITQRLNRRYSQAPLEGPPGPPTAVERP